MGARGRVSDSFHWAHAAAVKCEALAKKYDVLIINLHDTMV